jgi:ketosteroid isomerase-like protein
MSTQLDTINAIYADFLAGDIEALLGKLTDDVAWRSHHDPIVPWSGDYPGKSEVPKFFLAIQEHVDITAFDLKEMAEVDDVVFSAGSLSCAVKSNGKASTSSWIFVWRFRGDLVCSYDLYSSPELAASFRG